MVRSPAPFFADWIHVHLLRPLALAALLSLATAAPAAAAPKPSNAPDLAVTSATLASSTVEAGEWVQISVTVTNRGRSSAYASSGSVQLSANTKREASDATLRSKLIKHVRKGKARQVVYWTQIPAGTRAGTWNLLVCVRTTGPWRELNTVNNCRAAKVGITAPAAAPGGANLPAPAPVQPTPVVEPPVDPRTIDRDGDGVTEAAGDCRPHDATAFPGAEDKPDALALDSNCDGTDGDALDAVFVSVDGDDANPGTPAQPKRTIQRAIDAALPAEKDVYVAAGSYFSNSTLRLMSDVGIYGGFDATTWTRIAGDAPTTISSFTTAASALSMQGIVLQELKLSTLTSGLPGSDSIGLLLDGSSELRLENVEVTAAPGRDGANGFDGPAPGVNGGDGGDGGDSIAVRVAGTSTLELGADITLRSGDAGDGGNGGNGADGAAGASGTAGQAGGSGGAGGLGGISRALLVESGATVTGSAAQSVEGADGAAGNGGNGGNGGAGSDANGGTGGSGGLAAGAGGRGGNGGNGGAAFSGGAGGAAGFFGGTGGAGGSATAPGGIGGNGGTGGQGYFGGTGGAGGDGSGFAGNGGRGGSASGGGIGGTGGNGGMLFGTGGAGGAGGSGGFAGAGGTAGNGGADGGLFGAGGAGGAG